MTLVNLTPHPIAIYGNRTVEEGPQEVIPPSGTVARLATSNGPQTTTALLNEAAAAGVRVVSLGVQSTTLDDVFVHYTGRQLRDALQEPTAADRSVMVNRNR